jgi:uncharacterized protein
MSRFAHLTFTEAVREAQRGHGSDRAAALQLRTPEDEVDELGPSEIEFVSERDGFYIATVGATGWPYLQHRGGPPGFLHVRDGRTLEFADVRGNRQYVTAGNLAGNDRVALFFMDYARQVRLKVLGRAVVRAADEIAPTGLRTDGRVESVVTVTVEGFSWNCPQHITPRYTEQELAPLLERSRELADHNRALTTENAELRRRLGLAQEVGA